MSRLTSVAKVKRFLTLTSTGVDALIASLIPTESQAVERYLGRRFGFIAPTSRRLNGTGTASIVVPDQPILSVTGLTVCGASVSASDDGEKPGFVFDDTAIYLVGGAKFPSGIMNVAAVWSSGYQATENITVPAATANVATIAYEPSLYGFAMSANAVTYTANGAVLAPTTGSAAPTVGQFAFADGVFTFAAADGNVPVTIVYPYCPADISQAVDEMVGMDLRQRDNLGVTSKSLAGESVSYEKANMSKGTKDTLEPYVRRTPG